MPHSNHFLLVCKIHFYCNKGRSREETSLIQVRCANPWHGLIQKLKAAYTRNELKASNTRNNDTSECANPWHGLIHKLLCVCVCVCASYSVCVCVCVREREREREALR
jgi:hypothetical protein